MNNQPIHVHGLMQESPINVYPTLAIEFGINEAILLQQLHFLLSITKKAQNKYNYVNDEWWVYNSYSEWKDYFPWLSESTIKRLFIKLEKAGVVKSMQSVKNPSDRRKWYTIKYDTLRAKMSPPIVSNRDDEPSYQNDTMVVSNRDDGYSETTSETSRQSLPATQDTQPPTTQKSEPTSPNNAAKTHTPPTGSRGKPARGRSAKQQENDAYCEALVVAFGWQRDHMTGNDWSKLRRVAKQLVDVAAFDVTDVAGLYQHVKREAFNGQWLDKLTPTALVTNGRVASYLSSKRPAQSPPRIIGFNDMGGV